MKARHAAVMAGWAMVTISPAVKADTISTFTASGLFEDDSILGGTITINVTTGQVVSSQLTDSNPLTTSFTYVYNAQYFVPEGAYVLQVSSSSNSSDFPRLNLGLDTNTLVDYNGGILFSYAQRSPTGDISVIARGGGNFPGLETGSLTFTSSMSTVPLPASAPMFGAGLLALSAAGYMAKRKKAAAAT